MFYCSIMHHLEYECVIFFNLLQIRHFLVAYNSLFNYKWMSNNFICWLNNWVIDVLIDVIMIRTWIVYTIYMHVFINNAITFYFQFVIVCIDTYLCSLNMLFILQLTVKFFKYVFHLTYTGLFSDYCIYSICDFYLMNINFTHFLF